MGASVLLVEDEADIRMGLELFLSSEGFAVQAARNGLEALRWLEAGGIPDLILLDMKMPVMNGWEFAEAYRKGARASAPILVMTAAADAEARAAEVGAQGWVGKPFELEELLASVRAVLAAAREHTTVSHAG
jgi:DNA-binding response OmpR family regulator